MSLGKLISLYNKNEEYSKNNEYSFELKHVIKNKVSVLIPKTSVARRFEEENKMEITLSITKQFYKDKQVQNLINWAELPRHSKDYYRDLIVYIKGTKGYERSVVFTHVSILIHECTQISSDNIIIKVYAIQKTDKSAGVVFGIKPEETYKEAWYKVNNQPKINVKF